jgi:hypothetical protein
MYSCAKATPTRAWMSRRARCVSCAWCPRTANALSRSASGVEVERELDASAMRVRLRDMLSRASDSLGYTGARTTERELRW